MYCNGECENLDREKHKCKLTGEKLLTMKYSGSVSVTVYKHNGICEKDNLNLQSDKPDSNGDYRTHYINRFMRRR